MLLTDISVRALKPTDRQRTYFDDSIGGFGLRVSPGGTKTFVLIHGRSRTRTTLGRLGIISLADARTAAKRILAQKTLGQHQPKTKKFAEAYELFKTEHIAKKKARTQYDYQRVFDLYFLKKLGCDRLQDVAYETVTDITDKLANRPSEQAHALAVARTFLRWCARPPRRYIPHSPLEGLQLRTGTARKRVLENWELAEVWQSARGQGYPHGPIVQLLILTGQRRGEIAGLRRPWINEKDRTITLPDWITKNGVEHVFPYGDMVAFILETLPRRNSTDLLFPSFVSDDRPISGWSKYKKEMTAKIERWVLHDLRRTFGTSLARLKVPPHVVERLLNHKLGSITNQTNGMVSAVAEVYNRHHYMPEMREAATTWESHLASIISQNNALSKVA
jgi:integrase